MATSRIVWAKLKHGIGWWPGQVTEDFPADVTESLKKSPLAVVKFFNADEYEPITSAKDMIEYREEKRLELIKKGLIRLKNHDDEKNFIDDVKEAETRTGGDPSEVDNIKKELEAPHTPKKPSYSDIFKPPPKELPTPPQSSGIKFNFRKPSKNQSPQKRELHSSPTPQQPGPPKKYSCDICGLTSDRVGVVTAHRRSHSSADYSNVSVTSPNRGNSSSSGASMTGPTGASSSPVKTRVESPKSPIKEKAPAKKRGRKKKEQAKEDILNDWSDEEFESNIEKQREEADESSVPLLKKPRTDKELSDAFEALLQSTQPTELSTETKVKVEEKASHPDALIKNEPDSKDLGAEDALIKIEESMKSQNNDSGDHNAALTKTNTPKESLSTEPSETSTPPVEKCPSPVNLPKELPSPVKSAVETPEDMSDAFDAIMQSTQPPTINKTSNTKIEEKASPNVALTVSKDKTAPKDLEPKLDALKNMDKSEEADSNEKDSGPTPSETKPLPSSPMDKCSSPSNASNEPPVPVKSSIENQDNLAEAFDAIMQSTLPPILKAKGRAKAVKKSEASGTKSKEAPAPKDSETQLNTQNKNKVVERQKESQKNDSAGQDADFTPTKTPVKTPVKAPVKAPAKASGKAPAKAPVKAPEKVPPKAPEKAPPKAPEKAPPKPLEKAPAKAPAKAPEKAPLKAPPKAPEKALTKAPEKAPTKTTVKTPVKTPMKTPVKTIVPETPETIPTTQAKKATTPVTIPKDLPMAVKSAPVVIEQSTPPAPIQIASTTKPEIANTAPTVTKSLPPTCAKELPVAIKSAPAPVISDQVKFTTPQVPDNPVSNSQVVNSASILPKELPIAVKSAPVLIEAVPVKTEISRKSAAKTPLDSNPPVKKEKKATTPSQLEKSKSGKKPLQTYRGKKVNEVVASSRPNSAAEKGSPATETIISNKSSEKPTAAVKPSLANEAMKRNEDDSIIRQALQGTLKSSPEMQAMANAKTNADMGAETEASTGEEVNRVADQVVHLVPVENPDGTVTYMLLSLGNQGELCIDATEGAAPTIGEDAIYVDKTTDGDTFFASITQPNPPTNSAPQPTISQRTVSAPAHSPATAQVLLQNQLQGMQILQTNQQSNEVMLSHRHQVEGASLIEVSAGNMDSTQSISAGSATMLDLSSLGLTAGATGAGVQLQGGSEQHQIVFLAEDGSIINAENLNWADYAGTFINQ